MKIVQINKGSANNAARTIAPSVMAYNKKVKDQNSKSFIN